MVDIAKMIVELVAEDKATSKIQAFRAELGKAETSLGGLGSAAGLSGAAVTAAVAGMAIAAVKLGTEWDDALDHVRIATGATGETLEGLKRTIGEVGATTPVALGQIAAVTGDLNTRLGLTGADLGALSHQVLEFSRLTGTDAVQNTRLATRAFGDWSIATEDQGEALNKFFRGAQATGIGVTDLMDRVVRFGAPLRQLGFDFDEAVALMGKFEKEGVNADLVLGSLRIALGEMARQGVPAREGLQDVIEAIQGAGDASTANKLAMEIFGARAGPDMAAAIREGRLAIDDLVGTIRDGAETVEGAAAAVDDGAEAFAKAANRMKIAFEPVASGMFSFASASLESMSTFGAGLDALLADATPKLGRLAAVMQGAFGTLGGPPAAPEAPEVPVQVTLKEPTEEQYQDLMSGIRLPLTAAMEEVGDAGGEALADAVGESAAAESTKAMAPWLLKLNQDAFNLKEALRDVGTDETAIAGVLAYAHELAVVDQAVSQLTDRTLAAHIVALRNDGEQTEAAALAEAHLAAQADTAAQAHVVATAATRTLTDAVTKAAEAIELAQLKGVGGFIEDVALAEDVKTLQQLTQGLGDATEGWAKYLIATNQVAAAHEYGGSLIARQIERLEGEALATAEYTERVKGLTAAERAHYDAVRQVLGAEEATAELRASQAASPRFSVSSASMFGFGGSLSTQAHAVGADMARGFRENVGSGPEAFGREIAEGFSPVASEALMGAGNRVQQAQEAARRLTFEAGVAEMARYGPITAAERARAEAAYAQGPGGAGPSERVAAGLMMPRGYTGPAPPSIEIATAWLQQSADLRAEEAEAAKASAVASHGAATAATAMTNPFNTLGQAADHAAQATDRSTQILAQYTAGTGEATRTVYETTGWMLSAADAARVYATAVQEAAAATWKAAQQNAAALTAGRLTNAMGTIPTGLTYGQIYGGTATSGGQPTNVGPIPIVSPLTPGTLRGYQAGGVVSEPSYLVSMRSGRAWGSIAERGPEAVGPGGGGPVTFVFAPAFHGPVLGADLRDRAMWDTMAPAAIAAFRRKGARL